ncbi:hypothetical protein [Morganella psychrotolerans]|uniref:Uncharacterized protein n=1 Tax=Morganella psychrotolerans TaxID=368603 RepID=A0A1B8HRR4_9GAMM|nr:hypothetical protein [Morganella psychrotolerans]OBU12195.1 hypothetical protein AYY18_16870 [Morganella psychrotolerans]
MQNEIISQLDSYISALSRHRELADCTQERRTSYHVSHLDELIGVLRSAKREIENCRSASHENQ